ncbi:MAG: hypothetical protein ACR2N0_12125 [Rubrobacteraceae bacterium]|jgi:hypothetical protein
MVKLVERGGLAAVVGSVLGVLAAPVITSAYSLSGEGAGEAPPWEPALSGALPSLFSFASPATVYAAYGKLYLFVFLAFLLGLMSLREVRGNAVGSLGRWGFRLSAVGLLLNLAGNIADYWLPDFAGIGDWGFVVGTVLGLLLLIVGSTMLGVALLRGRSGFRVGAWLLTLSLPGMVFLFLLGFGNVPSGPALWLCFAWLALGSSLLARERRPVRPKPRVA